MDFSGKLPFPSKKKLYNPLVFGKTADWMKAFWKICFPAPLQQVFAHQQESLVRTWLHHSLSSTISHQLWLLGISLSKWQMLLYLIVLRKLAIIKTWHFLSLLASVCEANCHFLSGSLWYIGMYRHSRSFRISAIIWQRIGGKCVYWKVSHYIQFLCTWLNSTL